MDNAAFLACLLLPDTQNTPAYRFSGCFAGRGSSGFSGGRGISGFCGRGISGCGRCGVGVSGIISLYSNAGAQRLANHKPWAYNRHRFSSAKEMAVIVAQPFVNVPQLTATFSSSKRNDNYNDNEKLSSSQRLVFVDSLRNPTCVGYVSTGHNVARRPEREYD